jgi:hypothetical protein
MGEGALQGPRAPGAKEKDVAFPHLETGVGERLLEIADRHFVTRREPAGIDADGLAPGRVERQLGDLRGTGSRIEVRQRVDVRDGDIFVQRGDGGSGRSGRTGAAVCYS